MNNFRRQLRGVLLVWVLGIQPFAYALENTDIEALIQMALPNSSVGILVLETEQGKVLYQRNAKEYFRPASNAKLFTAASSLLALGKDFRFETRVLVDEKNIRSEKIAGNIYIHFSGDPSLTLMDIKKWILDLKTANIKQITGNIVIDDTCFQAPDYGSGWNWDNLSWYYAAPITSVIVDQNQIPLIFNSDSTIGKKVSVDFALQDGVKIPIRSNIAIVSEEDANSRCQLLVKMDPENALTLGGCWPIQAEPTTLKFALKDPYALLKQILIEAFKTENIQVEGKITKGHAPSHLKTLGLYQSKPLSELLIPVLQDSNNIYAESLLKTLGYKCFSGGTFQLGIEAMKKTLSNKSGFDFTELRLVDGSGLSTNNWMTPKQLAQLLLMMHREENMASVFKMALPISGKSQGTLKNRMQVSELHDRIRAKTGTMLGISTLAGYLTSEQGKELIFVIMIDHVLDKGKAKKFEDDLCRLLGTSKWDQNHE